MLLAGDVGGTKTRLAIFSEESGPRQPLVDETFRSRDYPGLDAIAREFLDRIDFVVDRATFGVAGPVIENHVEVTNLPWTVDADELRERLDLSSVRLLNDLASTANGVLLLERDELHTLQQGTHDPTGAIAVVAPGTGLGEAFLTWDQDDGRYRPHASEGGHTDFGPMTPRQIQLLRYLWARHEHVSYELVCSGMGIPNLYSYYRSGGYAEEPDWLTDQLAQADDPTPVIVNGALDEERECELCTLTLNTFVSILGAEAGNLALKVMATGGVYLGGGIPPRVLPALEQGRFLEAFCSKGRHADLMERVPVHVILNPDVAILGVAGHGLGL
ncbi:MAG: glucokinase [Chloroflexota bacterium]|nr:glucokinase [Chloroflexota bacterium]